ncbi:atrial natriuretic peptide receptor 1-like [Haliotis rufescens]|uniref:atrial natriuretic peptide receptor 1-like n=1 Tax=Haliotis rufescens TaxID=6454 RepID=UPI00201F7D4A|nr:atrial natriuretic peptide receptor 1-like [Haliotis rufescens]
MCELTMHACFLLCVVLGHGVWGVGNVTEYKVGVMLISGSDVPYSFERTGPAIKLAFQKVNREILNSSYQLVPVERPYDDICSARNATGVAADLFYKENIIALIGPACAYALDGVARLAGFWNIPIITGLGDGGMFKNKTDYPTLTRFAYCQCRLRKVFGSVFKQFSWSKIVVIYDVNDAHSDILGQTLKNGLQKGNIYPYMIQYYGDENPDFETILKTAADNARVVVLIVPGDSLRKFLLTAHDMGYTTNGEFVFMDVELFPFPGNYWGNHDWRRDDSRDPEAKAAFESLLRISLREPTSEAWKNFTCDVIRIASDDFNFTYGEEKVNYFVGAFHDGVVRYGMALNETLAKGRSVRDGYTIARAMWNETVLGVTGDVIIDDNGDRDTDFSILDLNPQNGEFQVVAIYWGDRPGYTPVEYMNIHWPGTSGLPPPNVPRCGFKGDAPVCAAPDSVPIYVVVVLVLFGVIIVGLIGTFFIYRRVRWERDLKDMSWRVSLSDIIFRSKANDSQRFSKTSIAWLGDNSGNNSDDVGEQCFAKIGVYKGETVAVKKVECDKIDLTRNVLMEFKQVRDLQHENLTRFVGAVIEPSKNYLLTEYCNKGSLQDVLQNDNIKLDWTFRLSLLRDIARGMAYLHKSEVRCHGSLRSSNCVVDGKFSLKVTDFGLHSLRANKSGELEGNTHAKFEKMLWVAPEHLMDEGGTQKGDVYSFGIILEEMIVRSAPYDTYRGIMDPQDIVERVASHDNPPFRPKVNQAFGPKGVHELMHHCWVENPEDRPNFDAIAKTLRTLQGSKTDNIVEALIHRLEDYASNLEDIVEERTQQLIAEKKKSEALLYQILPRSVAEQLKQGKSVVPETYESVSIFFSDVVGFTSMCSESTPMEVVTFLSDLYSLFDSVIDNFDVYKVETIGDAYMVVSGVPIRNGQRHAVEICRLALALLSGVETFVFRHRPQDKLNVRIGIHTGPCAAGVVGLKMPRYCLFGDTVNTASRMESTGEALRIHLSGTTKAILDKVGQFDTPLRGQVPMKGKGLQTTYWLVGEKHVTKDVEKEQKVQQKQQQQVLHQQEEEEEEEEQQQHQQQQHVEHHHPERAEDQMTENEEIVNSPQRSVKLDGWAEQTESDDSGVTIGPELDRDPWGTADPQVWNHADLSPGRAKVVRIQVQQHGALKPEKRIVFQEPHLDEVIGRRGNDQRHD